MTQGAAWEAAAVFCHVQELTGQLLRAAASTRAHGQGRCSGRPPVLSHTRHTLAAPAWHAGCGSVRSRLSCGACVAQWDCAHARTARSSHSRSDVRAARCPSRESTQSLLQSVGASSPLPVVMKHVPRCGVPWCTCSVIRAASRSRSQSVSLYKFISYF